MDGPARAPFQRIVVPRPAQPPCPAASLIAEAAGGTGCACRITQDLIDSRRNPSALITYCFSADGYQQCPIWRADRDEWWRSRIVRDLLNSAGDLNVGHPEDRERNAALQTALDARERDQWQSQRERDS